MKTAQINAAFKAYIIANLDFAGYPSEEKTFINLFATFNSEYGHEVKRQGEQKAFTEWLSGLPSVLSVHHYYYDVQKLLAEFGVSRKMSDTKAFEFFLAKIYLVCRRELNRELKAAKG